MAVGGAQKADDFQPHPVKDQLPGVDFCMTSSPPWRNSLSVTLFLKTQKHYSVFIT